MHAFEQSYHAIVSIMRYPIVDGGSIAQDLGLLVYYIHSLSHLSKQWSSMTLLACGIAALSMAAFTVGFQTPLIR